MQARTIAPFIITIIAGFVLSILFIGILMFDKGYQNGQIDALNGKYKYEKVVSEKYEYKRK